MNFIKNLILDKKVINNNNYLLKDLVLTHYSGHYNRKIADFLALEFDGSEIEVDDITFANAGFGQAEGRKFYAPVPLATVDVIKGPPEVIISGIQNSLNIGAVALIPTEKVADSDPVTPVTPEPAPSKTGCGSSIALTASLISILGLGALSFLAIKGRKED